MQKKMQNMQNSQFDWSVSSLIVAASESWQSPLLKNEGAL